MTNGRKLALGVGTARDLLVIGGALYVVGIDRTPPWPLFLLWVLLAVGSAYVCLYWRFTRIARA